MRYKVMIQPCRDPRSAGAVAFGVARRAGVAPEKVFGVISEKTICIRKKAGHDEALQLKNEFEALGAEVDLVQLDEPRTTGQRSAAVSAPREPDDDEEPAGRILTSKEYAARMRDRGDIFCIENNRPLNRIEVLCLVVAILTGMFMSTREITIVSNDFLEPGAPERVVTVTGNTIPRPPSEKPPEVKPKILPTPTKSLHRKASTGSGIKSGGGGSPYERVVKTGLLALVADQIRGVDIANADIFGKGGYTENIDAMLLGMGGLKTGGGGGSGRKGETGMGFGTGYNSGFDGGAPGGIGDDISVLFNDNGADNLQLKPRATALQVHTPTFTRGGALTSGRSRQSIARVVQQNLAALRHAYNQRLREKPGLKGRITVKFAIDEFGNVVFCAIEESTISDPALENVITMKIGRWKFETIDKVGDITEVIYPFVFSQ